MKYKFVFLMLFACFMSCEERMPEPALLPEWIMPRIAELEEQEGGCDGCQIKRHTYNEEYFYWVVCSNFSCLDCEIYHYNGELVDWTIVDKTDYEQNRANPKLIWECGDDELLVE